jgi:small subunit ribosomal protein S4
VKGHAALRRHPVRRPVAGPGDHILVNGRKVNIASYEVKPGDAIALGPKAAEIPDAQEAMAANPSLPPWLRREGTRGRVVSLSSPGDFEPYIDPQRIVEWYSR